ncbi:hypothetical protein K2173_002562 [Erythroxylum novogranatense]|uniref:Uncharacterized protein n=1 Tax=Erythroxylum novogranatense TaxID=1862640 RepID=A0AAV8TT40_9ROSI|nr:hypothetical protein K2173_002562 [Erythroxylum novogranatense]
MAPFSLSLKDRRSHAVSESLSKLSLSVVNSSRGKPLELCSTFLPGFVPLTINSRFGPGRKHDLKLRQLLKPQSFGRNLRRI